MINEIGISIPTSSSGGVRGIGFKYIARQHKLWAMYGSTYLVGVASYGMLYVYIHIAGHILEGTVVHEYMPITL